MRYAFWDRPLDKPTIDAAKQFYDLMARLDQQMYREHLSDTAEFIVNDDLVLSGQGIVQEYKFLKAFHKATFSKYPTPTVFFDALDKPAKDPVYAALYGVSATYQKRLFLVEWGKNHDVLPLFRWSPPVGEPFRVTPRTLEYTSVDPSGSKWKADRRYMSFRCPAFKGNPGHMEWWHFQVKKLGKFTIDSQSGRLGPKWPKNWESGESWCVRFTATRRSRPRRRSMSDCIRRHALVAVLVVACSRRSAPIVPATADRLDATSQARTVSRRTIAADKTSTCAILRGTIWCWGTERFAPGVTSDTLREDGKPKRIDAISGVEEIVPGGAGYCAQTSDGRVYCWGFAKPGEDRGPDLRPTLVFQDSRQRLVGDDDHVCFGAKADWICWGNVFTGTAPGIPRCANGLFGGKPEKLCALEASTLGIAVGPVQTCVIEPTRMLCHGDHYPGVEGVRGKPAVFRIANIESAGLGPHHGCVIQKPGVVLCWGAGPGTGLGAKDPVGVPQEIGLSDVVMISVAGLNSCALRSDGAVYCWGDNRWGQVGDGTTRPRERPVRIDVPPAAAIAMSETHTCAQLRDQSVMCWGSGDRGEMGSGPTPVDQTTPLLLEWSARLVRE